MVLKKVLICFFQVLIKSLFFVENQRDLKKNSPAAHLKKKKIENINVKFFFSTRKCAKIREKKKTAKNN